MSDKKQVRVDELIPDQEFWLPEETMGLESDYYRYLGKHVDWQLENAVDIELRGETYQIPASTYIEPQE